MIEASAKEFSSSDIGDIPKELTYNPVPYVAFVGLNAGHNEIHAHIWNAFTVNRQTDRCPLYFKLIGEKYHFIPSKAKV